MCTSLTDSNTMNKELIAGFNFAALPRKKIILTINAWNLKWLRVSQKLQESFITLESLRRLHFN